MEKHENPTPKFHLKNTICWHITHSCNLNCSFCDVPKNEFLIKKQLKYLEENWDKYKKGFKNLKGQWEIFFVGGEPFSVPNILKITNDLIKMGHKISVATNFSYSLDIYKKFLKIVDGNICLFLASFKPEYYKFEPYLKKAIIINELVKKQNGFFAVKGVATKKHIAELYNYGQNFKKNNVPFNLQVERHHEVYLEYSKEDIKKIEYFGNTYGLDNNHCFKGKICYAGINYFVLDHKANAYRCHSSRKDEKEFMGNIVKNNIVLFKNPKKCFYDSCACKNPQNKNLIIK